MSFNRGSESWRKVSRFRRRSLVKAIEAEVLEPRCLLTDATGTLGSDAAPADAAAPLTGDVVIGPDLWDDAGLTLQQIGDLLHVFRTRTQTDVITPMLADQITSLNIIGRANADDELTLKFASSSEYWLPRMSFDGGNSGIDYIAIYFDDLLTLDSFWNVDITMSQHRLVNPSLDASLSSIDVIEFANFSNSDGNEEIIWGFSLIWTENDLETDTWRPSDFAPPVSSDTGSEIQPADSMGDVGPEGERNLGASPSSGDAPLIGQEIATKEEDEGKSAGLNSAETDAKSADVVGEDNLDVVRNLWSSLSPGDVLLIGQGIATDGEDEGESAGLDTAGADAESSPLADTTPDDDPASDTFASTNNAESASDTDSTSANLSDDFLSALPLEPALSHAFLQSLGQPPSAS